MTEIARPLAPAKNPQPRFRVKYPQDEQEWKVPDDLSGDISPPDWIDPGWKGMSKGSPVVRVPQGGPDTYVVTSTAAFPGDTIKWIPRSVDGPHYMVVPGSLDPGEGRAPASMFELLCAQSGSSLEDRVLLGITPVDQLTTVEKARLSKMGAAGGGRTAIARALDEEDPQTLPEHATAVHTK